MRVTNRMMIDNAIQHMTENLDRLHAAGERVASGKVFQNASDDPVAASYSLTLRSTMKTTAGYRATADMVSDWMSASDFAMQQMETIGNRAANLILRGLNDTLGEGERDAALAEEMKGLLRQAMEVANSKHNDQYLFSGLRTNQPPFAFDVGGVVRYTGGSGTMRRTIGPEQTIDINTDGQAAFENFLQQVQTAARQLETNDTENLQDTLNALELSRTTVSENRTAAGARQRQVQAAVEYLDKVELEVKGLLSKKEDVNMAEAISNLRGQETAYQSVLEVSQRAISSLNLFDYLR
jgi:flagellar hook-associated protein 3 FlgL